MTVHRKGVIIRIISVVFDIQQVHHKQDIDGNEDNGHTSGQPYQQVDIDGTIYGFCSDGGGGCD